MAETYRGLTIRIGGDTSGLSKALKAANSAIRTTQGQLRSLAQAARLDPGNQGVIRSQLSAIGDLSVDAASKLRTLREQYANLAGAKGAGTDLTIGQLAQRTDDAALAAKRALDNYNEVDKALERVYVGIEKITGEDIRGLEGADLVDKIAELKSMDGEVAHLASELERLNPMWHEAFADLENTKAVAALEDMGYKIVRQEAEVENLTDRYSQLKDASSSAIGSGLGSMLESTAQAASDAEERFRRLDDAAKLNPTNITLAHERMLALRESSRLTKEQVAILERQIGTIESSGIKLSGEDMRTLSERTKEAEQRFKDSQKRVSELAAELDRAKSNDSMRKIAKDAEGVSEGAEQADRSIEEIERDLTKAHLESENFFQVWQENKSREGLLRLKDQLLQTQSHLKELKSQGKNAFAEVGTAAVVAAVDIGNRLKPVIDEVINAAVTIDSAYRDMRKTVDATEEEYEALRQAAIDYSQTHVTSADQVLEIQALGGQFGIATESLGGFADAISNLDVATNINAEDAAIKVGQMINVMDDLDSDNVDRFSDALVRLGNNMPAQESSIMEIAQRLSAVGGIAGMTTPEVLAWSAAIAATGQKSESAATAINNTISGIATAVAAGGDDLQLFADVAGKSAEDFKAAWEKSPTDALRMFIEGLRNLDESGESALAQLEDMGITGVRQQQALLGLMQTVENLDDALLMSQDAWDGVSDEWGAAGDAAREAGRKAEGLSGALAMFDNSTAALQASFGEGLVPLIQLGTGMIQSLTDAIAAMPPELVSAITSAAGITVAMATLAPVLEAIGGAFAGLAGAAETAFVTIGVGLLDLTAAVPPVALAIGAVAAVIGGGYLISTQLANERTERLSSQLTSMRSAASDAATGLRVAKEEMQEGAKSGAAMQDEVDALYSSLEQHAQAISDIGASYRNQIDDIERAQANVHEFAGATEVSNEQMGELQWTAQQLSEMLGTTITAEDILTGEYTDQDGEVQQLTESIDGLAEARVRDAEAAAYADMYKEAYSAQKEAAEEAAVAQREYDEELSRLADEYMLFNDVSRAEAEAWAANTSEIRPYAEALDDATRAQREAEQTAENLAYMNGLATKASQDSASALESFIYSHDGITAAVMASGESLQRFQSDLELTGVSTEQLSQLTDEQLADMAEHYDGTYSSILEWMAEYNRTDLGDKKPLVNAQGNVITGAARDSVQNLQRDLSGLRDIRVYGTATGSLFDGTATTVLGNIADSIRRLNGSNVRVNAQITGGKFASGGIARHMAGGIATSATLTQYGLVGEAGAEYYDGQNIVPLTRTNVERYASGFTDVIADKVASRIGVGNVSNIHIGDLTVNNDEELEAAVRRVAVLVARRRDM